MVKQLSSSPEVGLLLAEELQDARLLGRQDVALLANGVGRQKRDHALLQRGRHPQRPQLRLDAVRELGKRSLWQYHVLGGLATSAREVWEVKLIMGARICASVR